MAPPGSSALTVDGVTLSVVVQRKQVKHVNARLSGSTLRVSAPVGLPQREVERAVRELARRLVHRVRAREINVENGLLQRARQLAGRFPRPPAVCHLLFSTTQWARWGSYSSATGTIRLHAALREMPPWVLDAVMAHELAHVFHRDHSASFWKLVRTVCPETDRARAFLAGVSWLARRWDRLPPVERAQLARFDKA